MKKHGILAWTAFGAFLAGIWLAGRQSEEFLMNYGVLNAYYLNQYAYGSIGESFSGYILWERGKMIVLALLLKKALPSRLYFFLTESIVFVLFGFLFAAAEKCLGITGIVIMFVALFPQWLFYLAAFWTYLKTVQENSYLPTNTRDGAFSSVRFSGIIPLFFTVIFLLLGMLSEIYINPVILKQVYQIL